MPVIDRIREFFRPKAQSPEDPRISLNQWYNEVTGTADLPPLPLITEQSARTVSAVYRGVSLLSGAVAILPLNVIHRPTNAISQVAPNHKLAPLLNYAPNPQQSMTAFTFKSLIMQSRIFGGNFFARILYDNAARVTGMRYYHYFKVRVIPLMVPPYTRHYVFTEQDGTMSDPIPDDEVIHIMSEANNGLIGESLIYSAAKPAIQQQLFMMTQAQSLHDGAIKPGGVVKLPAGMTPEQKKRYEQFFKLAYQGSTNTGKLLWLDAGAEFTPLTPSLSLVDLATIDFLRFGVNDIARFMGIPSHLLNEQSQTSAWGTGLEQIGRAFLLYTLEPSLRAIEEELRLKLFGNGDYYPQFDRTPLLVTDAQTQAQVESTKINSGVITINESRKGANLPPQEDGDVSLINSSMVALRSVVQPEPASPPSDAPAEPAPKPARARKTPQT